MSAPGRRPHFAWYFLALLPFAGGIALAVRFFLGMMTEIDDMPRVDVPGEAMLTPRLWGRWVFKPE